MQNTTHIECMHMNGTLYLIENQKTGAVYVGKTVNAIRSRWNLHRSRLRRGKHHNRHLQNSWNKHGESVFAWIVVATYTTRSELDAAEIETIARYRSSGTVYNTTDGGDGRTNSYVSPETRQKLSAVSRRYYADPAIRAQHRTIIAVRYADPAYRARHQASMEATRTPEARERHRAGLRRYHADPAQHQRHVKEVMSALRTPEARQRMSQGQVKAWQDPEVRARRSAGIRQALQRRTYRLTSGSGEVVITTDLRGFCRERSIGVANMYAVAQGKRRTCQGWTAVILATP
jgi:group I intron endonuclease